ncbi:MAG: HNH endonuclease signature motif containing protein, partial [Propionicimonas sp.]
TWAAPSAWSPPPSAPPSNSATVAASSRAATNPPNACHAHHLVPWWAGGTTALTNLALVCAHHHGIVEPGHDPTADRWRIQLRADGTPQAIPPRRVDPDRRPRLHTRFLAPRRE